VRKLGILATRSLRWALSPAAGSIVVNPEALEALPISEADIHRAAAAELRELERREEAYRGGHDPPDVAGKTVVLIDGGLATGATMRAATLAVRQLQPAHVMVAVPVAAAETCSSSPTSGDRGQFLRGSVVGRRESRELHAQDVVADDPDAAAAKMPYQAGLVSP